MFEYEHTSKYNLSKETRELLVNEIEGDEFHLSPLQGKIILNEIEEFLDDSNGKNIRQFRDYCMRVINSDNEIIINEMLNDLEAFTFTDPKLPSADKNYLNSQAPEISTEDTREKIIDTISNISSVSETALLAMYVFRQMDKINWIPYIKAAIERNPVCFNDLDTKSTEEVYEILIRMPNESIYDSVRLALPDEVWNFRRGDGIEKAFLLADFIIKKDPPTRIYIEILKNEVKVLNNNKQYIFVSKKLLRKTVEISGTDYFVSDLS
jgi:hypothetical protein